jgi:hypothetical protein
MYSQTLEVCDLTIFQFFEFNKCHGWRCGRRVTWNEMKKKRIEENFKPHHIQIKCISTNHKPNMLRFFSSQVSFDLHAVSIIGFLPFELASCTQRSSLWIELPLQLSEYWEISLVESDWHDLNALMGNMYGRIKGKEKHRKTVKNRRNVKKNITRAGCDR